jgi:hypothetical protein
MRFNVFDNLIAYNYIPEEMEWKIPFDPEKESDWEKFLFFLNLRICSPQQKWLGRIKLNIVDIDDLFIYNNVHYYTSNYHNNLGQTFNSLNAHTYKEMINKYYSDETFLLKGYFEILYIDDSEILTKKSHYYKLYYRVVYN